MGGGGVGAGRLEREVQAVGGGGAGGESGGLDGPWGADFIRAGGGVHGGDFGDEVAGGEVLRADRLPVDGDDVEGLDVDG